MKTKKREQTRSPARDKFYRCPACGEMVDNTNRESIRFHHHHVLHPRLDLFVTLPVVPACRTSSSHS
ncbi:MAG TPA: hypothetical protein VH252_07100 [Chthoniobacterales bacterium]|nr:hypothetical protein [Chthoniobacterales bacterium]